MFSGKSEELMRRVRRAKIAQRHVTVVKPALDDRYARTEIVSHAGATVRADIVGDPAELLTVGRGERDVIAIDEVQFFGAELLGVVDELLARGVDVIAAGLDLDFRRRPWRVMSLLLCLAERVDKLSAVCEVCGEDASFTQRLVHGKPATARDKTVRIGGHELYEARCRDCYEGAVPAAGSVHTA
jgi:thymidine kinase